MSFEKSLNMPDPTRLGVKIERAGDVLTFVLDNADHGNEIDGAMFDAMLSELQCEVSRPVALVLRIRARGKVFCTGRERAGRLAFLSEPRHHNGPRKGPVDFWKEHP